MAGATPTQNSLKLLRKHYDLVWVTEHWCHFSRKRKDLWGFADILAIREDEVCAVQTTSYSNLSARVKKIANHENVDAVRNAGIRILCHGWKKNSRGRWEVKVVDCS